MKSKSKMGMFEMQNVKMQSAFSGIKEGFLDEKDCDF